jgi:O-acetyl-ADP-ribose deacetylase (regulator of RNase III)
MKKIFILILLISTLLSDINSRSLEEKMNNCIKYLLEENSSNKELFNEFNNIEKKYKSNEKQRINKKFNLYRKLNSLRLPGNITQEYIENESFLSEIISEKGIIEINNLSPITDNESSIFNNIYLWKGDITLLKIDAIVNAANNQLLGCWIPLHNCIDNIIFSYAGIQLRNEMDEIMKKQKKLEQPGNAKLSKAYHLPSKFIIHTVGPQVIGVLTEEHKKLLKNSYLNVLKLAKKNNIKSLAFCCISTGIYNFPNDEAAEIAINTVIDFLEENKHLNLKIIFNVYKDIDEIIYKKKLNEKIYSMKSKFNKSEDL